MVIAAVLVAGAGFGNYAVVTARDARIPVLVMARSVGWGERVTDEDVSVAQAVPDRAVRFVRAADRATVVGKLAAATLPAGSLLSAEQVTDSAIPGSGQSVVGLLAKPGQLPARGLHAGDRVEVTSIANGQSTSDSSGSSKPAFPARVLESGPPDANGGVTVDVLVGSDIADRASAAAAGSVVITLVGEHG